MTTIAEATGVGWWARALLITSCVFLSTARVFALDDVEDGSARQHFESAVIYVKAGEFERAAQEFAQAYALEPHPATLLNLARVQAKLRRHLAAYHSFSSWLDDPAVQSNPEQRTKVEQERAAVRQMLAELEFHILPQPEMLSINGEPVDASTKSLVVDPGRVLIEVAATGYTVATREVTVEHGGTLDITLTLSPETPVAPPLVDSSPTPGHSSRHFAQTNIGVSEPAPVSATPRGVFGSDADGVAWWQRSWIYPAAGTVVFGGVALGLERYANWRFKEGYVPSRQAMDEWRARNPDWYEANIGELRQQKRTIDDLNTAALALAIGSGVCAVAAVTLLLIEEEPSKSAGPQVTIQIQPTGLALYGVF